MTVEEVGCSRKMWRFYVNPFLRYGIRSLCDGRQQRTTENGAVGIRRKPHLAFRLIKIMISLEQFLPAPAAEFS